MNRLIGFLSDAHGNGGAFDKGISLLRSQGVNEFYFLGDAVGYIPSPSVLESIERLGSSVHCIQGNHESMLLEKAYGDHEDIYQLRRLSLALSSQQCEKIASWPTSRRLEVHGPQMLLVHGSPLDYTRGYVYPDSNLAAFDPREAWIFMGNTHRPFVRQHKGVTYVNVGSCGLPRDDGRFGSVCLFDATSQQARILRYDITQETKTILEQFPSVHPLVRDVFRRHETLIEGEIL